MGGIFNGLKRIFDKTVTGANITPYLYGQSPFYLAMTINNLFSMSKVDVVIMDNNQQAIKLDDDYYLEINDMHVYICLFEGYIRVQEYSFENVYTQGGTSEFLQNLFIDFLRMDNM